MMVGGCISGPGGFSTGRLLYENCICVFQRIETEKQTKYDAASEDANLFPQAFFFISHALIGGFAQPLIEFLLLRRAPAKEHVIYKGIFEQGQEHKHKTAHEVDVNGFHIGNLWERLPKVGVNCCHGEHRCHTQAQTSHVETKNLASEEVQFHTQMIYSVHSEMSK